MPNFVVGSIEDHDVIYVSEKDILFCKNTSVPYNKMRGVLIDREYDRCEIKNDLIATISDTGMVSLGCLTTTLENCIEINKEIKKIKKDVKRISKSKNQ